MRNVVMGFVMLAVAGGSAFAGEKGASKTAVKDEDAIKAVVADFSTAWGKHDAKAISGLFADDGTVINPGGRVAKGKVEVEKLFTDEQTGALKDSTWNGTVAMWHPVGTASAFVDIDADCVGMKGPDGKVMPGKHHLAALMTKKVNKWSITDLRPYFFAGPPPGAKPAPAPAAAPAAAPAKK